jgi:hypothetical protein
MAADTPDPAPDQHFLPTASDAAVHQHFLPTASDAAMHQHFLPTASERGGSGDARACITMSDTA